jgi:hypothetical protein
MCRKLLILCFALVVIAMSTPVLAAPSYSAPLKIDFNGEGVGQTGRTQTGWEGWDFDRSPTVNTFTKPFTIGGSKVSVELKGVKNDASMPGSRMRGDQASSKLGDVHQDLFFVATTGAGVGLLGLDYIQVKFTLGTSYANKDFRITAFAWDSAYNTYHDSYNDDYAAWGVVNPSTNGGYHTLRYDDPCTPEDENGIDKANIPILAQHLMQGPQQSDPSVGWYTYSSTFDVTADATGVVMIYGWFNGAFQGSYHMPINGLIMVPEPMTVALLGLGGLALLRRRK